MNKFVDVIIPTYNREEYIERSIKSVLNQTYSYVNVYVIDDNSTDNTESVVKSIDDVRVHYFKNLQNRGANYCRNRGIQLSNSKYIAFNDSDDVWEPNKLEYQMKLLGDTNNMIFSPYKLLDDGKISIVGVCDFNAKESIYSQLLGGNLIGTPTILMTRELFLDVGGFNEELKRFQDWEFCLRIAKKVDILYCPVALVNAYRLKECITKSKDAAFESLRMIARANQNEIVSHSKIYDWVRLCLDCKLSLTNIEVIMEELNIDDEEREKIYIESLINVDKEKEKMNSYLQYLACILEKEFRIIDFFRKNKIGGVSIYGNSIAGRALAALLIRNGIEVSCFIDNNTSDFCHFKLLSPKDFNSGRNEGVVINTVPSLENEINKVILANRIVTIKELMEC